MISVKDQTQTLANYQRGDKLFVSKNLTGSNLRRLLAGLAFEIGRVEGYFDNIENDVFPDRTNLLLEEWERALQIPDDCFFIVDNKVDRIRNILTKLTALGVSTRAGFEALALTFGIIAEVLPGAETITFPLSFPIMLTNSIPRWTMLVNIIAEVASNTFPIPFPYTFLTNANTAIINCLFQKLAPENVKVLFNFV